jgi:oligopeptide transport system ATP-binding protein
MSSSVAPLLEVKNLTTHFFTDAGIVKAVDGVSFTVQAGETLAIVGESGSGKSITALSILGLIPNPPGEIIDGEILFEGRDLLELDDDEVREVRGNKIAMIFQEPMTSLNPVLTVGEQVAEPIEVHKNLPRESAMARCIELLAKVQISDGENRARAYPHQFSGGMRQRVMIAMALSCSPKLIISDEPTTALDVTVQAQVLELLKELTHEQGAAQILITHDLGVVARYANHVNVMYAGRIVESGDAISIYDDPRHPYTIGLMASIPSLDDDVKEKLIPIEGQPPNLAQLPPGCPFRPRCRYAIDKCAEQRPELVEVGAEHSMACWIDVREQ